ncbi:MAG: IS982 family transposase [Bacteroidota bacterium]
MHDLHSNYIKVHEHVKQALKENLVQGDNLQFYSNPPKMSDVAVISLALTAECLGIDSENLLWSKIKKDYSKQFAELPHRTRFNSRRKRLQDWIIFCSDKWSEEISGDADTFIIDSIPLPTCKLSREHNSKSCRRPSDDMKASKGYSSTDKQYFIGFKLHLITCLSGVFQECALLPANVHDITFLKQLNQTHLQDCTLIGDRAYRSHPLQLSLFEDFSIQLDVPYRHNQRDYKPYSFERKIQRKRIETTFAQYCDEFLLKRNYAKSTDGLQARVYSKIGAMTFKQYWNYLNGNKISNTKHSLAA